MLKFCNLYSGSSGNCSLVSSESTHILIDAGVSLKKMTTALENIGLTMSDISGILITHEHSDHVKGLPMVSKKHGTSIYTNKNTWSAMKTDEIHNNSSNIEFVNNEKFKIGNLEILPFPIPHDAADPCGFNIFNNDQKISIATDIGHITPGVINCLKNSSFVLLESNYEPEILKISSYPDFLKRRIVSNYGHLSNHTASETILELSNYGLNHVMLGHLSKENNAPALAYQNAECMLNENNLSNIKLSVASPDTPSGYFEI